MIEIVTTDTDALPTALLVRAKDHLRVDHPHDDEFIKEAIARAIAEFEGMTEITVAPTTYRWSPAAAEFDEDGIAAAPMTPIGTFAATVPGDPAPVDVTTSYSFATAGGAAGAWRYTLAGGYASGLGIEIVSGFTDPLLIPPGIIDHVFRIMARNYENREILVPAGQALVPEYKNFQFAPYWLPKV